MINYHASNASYNYIVAYLRIRQCFYFFLFDFRIILLFRHSRIAVSILSTMQQLIQHKKKKKNTLLDSILLSG